MLRPAILLPLLALCLRVHAQSVTPAYILDQPPLDVVRLDTACAGPICFRIACGFGSAEILDTGLVAWVRESGAVIGGVDLVYTSYRLTSDFDQRELDRKRLEHLQALFPELFDNNLIEWRLIRQNGLREAELGERFFHGFILRLRPPPPVPDKLLRAAGIKPGRALTTTEELKVIEEYLKGGTSTWSTRSPKVRCKHYFLPRAERKAARGVRYGRRSIWGRKKHRECDTTFHAPIVGSTIMAYPFLDSVVFKVLDRNPHWTDAVIVEDITGSMAPYTAQTFVWRRLQQAATPYVRFVFFNDGDLLPDGPVGRSGGAYEVVSDSIAPVEGTALEAMRRGYGGLAPENDIEAMLYAQEAFPDLGSIVLIADNWAPVRDMRLLAALRVPVHVVLCGSFRGRVHHHYIDIAMATKGSVHTIESDLDLLGGAVEGRTIALGDQTFQVRKGRLVLVR